MSTGTDSGKTQSLKKYGRHEKDTGSPEVQVALLTSRIEQLSTHFKKHVNDLHSMRGLFALVSRRKRLLNYLKGENVERYRHTISELGIRK